MLALLKRAFSLLNSIAVFEIGISYMIVCKTHKLLISAL